MKIKIKDNLICYKKGSYMVEENVENCKGLILIEILKELRELNKKLKCVSLGKDVK